ncbi:MAG: hypothetical protein OXE02_03145 [Chloroflexi bacterium]|nr:hypothetical protein [Chloroflexota bacterium]
MQRRLWLLWVSGTAIGLGVGAGLAEVVSSAIAVESGLGNLLFSWRWQIPVGLSFGVPVLLAQYLILRAFVPGAFRWVVMTLAGLLIGAAIGAFVGLIPAIWTMFLAAECRAASLDACSAGVSLLVFPAAGGAAGAATGGAMGALLRLGPRAWSQEWTCPLARAWAGSGAVFWLLAPLLVRPPISEAGLLDTDASLATVALMGVAGLAAGVAGGALSAGHFVRTARGG